MHPIFLRWWLIVSVITIGAIFALAFGLFSALLQSDKTYLSVAIILLFVITTGFIGRLSWTPKPIWLPNPPKRAIELCWFSSEIMTGLGMLGTVAGFLLMLGPSFASLDLNNFTQMTEAITSMASGMSTALTTTLVGLICSMLVKIQLVNLEHGITKA